MNNQEKCVGEKEEGKALGEINDVNRDRLWFIARFGRSQGIQKIEYGRREG